MQPFICGSDSVALKFRGSIPGATVPVTTVDSIVRDLALLRVDYIKMDVEGSERSALKGMAETLLRFHPRLSIAMEHRFDDPRAIPEMVSSVAGDYRVQWGPCEDLGNALRPTVIAFF